MKLQFKKPKSVDVVFRRDGETLQFTLTAPPAGYFAWLRTMFSPPVVYVNGKEQAKDDPNYDTLFSYAWLAKSLEPSEVLETEAPNGSAKRSAWEQYANSVRGEFRSAHFSEGDVATLLENLTAMEKNTNDEDQSEARAGNF